MSSLAAQTIFTPEEYLASERKATLKNEYISGEILAMSGASNAHNLITLDIGTELNIQLRERECLVYANDMRVKTSSKSAYFYPDVVVVCGEPKFEDIAFSNITVCLTKSICKRYFRSKRVPIRISLSATKVTSAGTISPSNRKLTR